MFELSPERLDPTALRTHLISRAAGAYCSYEGWVRDHNDGKAVAALHYHGYPELAQSMASIIIEEAKIKYSILAASIAHRIGSLEIGDGAVWVGVTARHRGDSFQACQYIVENVKHRLPIWKKEIYADGTVRWIENNHSGFADPTNH